MRLVFKRSEQDRFRRLEDAWRYPRGHHNKIKSGEKGLKPKIGYKKSEKEKALRIGSIKEIEEQKPKEIIIASAVGKKKRMELEKYCKDKKIEILN